MTWRASKELMERVYHFTQFPQTSVSLQQMVQFGMSALATGERSHANCYKGLNRHRELCYEQANFLLVRHSLCEGWRLICRGVACSTGTSGQGFGSSA